MSCICQGIDNDSWELKDGKCPKCNELIDDNYENLDVEILNYLNELSEQHTLLDNMKELKNAIEERKISEGDIREYCN